MNATANEMHPDDQIIDNEAEMEQEGKSEIIATAATVVVVAAGVALFEAALLPGVVIGVAAMWAPKYFPKVADAMSPIFRSTIRGTYKLAQKSKDVVSGANAHVKSIVEDAKSEAVEAAGKSTTTAKA